MNAKPFKCDLVTSLLPQVGGVLFAAREDDGRNVRTAPIVGVRLLADGRYEIETLNSVYRVRRVKAQ